MPLLRTKEIRALRKNIARILTIMREEESLAKRVGPKVDSAKEDAG